MNATVACVADATVMPLAAAFTAAFPDPLDHDLPSDDVVVTTRRGMVRMALVATEVASRFQREGVQHDAMAWMLSPRALFDGAAAIDACTDRDACLRGTLLHGLSLGLDAEPGEIDALVDDNDVNDGNDGAADSEAIDPRCAGGGDLDAHQLVAEGHRTGGGPRHDNVLPLRPKAEPAPRLFTATVVADDGFETVHAFHASFAMDEAEIAGRLYMRMGAAAADAAIVLGFDHTSPIVEALVSQAICDTLMMIDAEPSSPLAAGLDLNIEQRFLA